MHDSFAWLGERAAGVLLPVFSLPGGAGIGSFGDGARVFLDGIAEAGMQYWQVCPLGPTGFGDSPYQSFSAFAGNPYFIDLAELVEKKWLTESELKPLRQLPNDHVDYGALYVAFWPVLEKAFERFQKVGEGAEKFELQGFCEREKSWLLPYACFQSLKQFFNGAPWFRWEKRYQSFDLAVKTGIFDSLQRVVETHQFAQWLFSRQWEKLRHYAKKRGISIIGDVPLFVGLDSADVWANREIFDLGDDGMPLFVAGVPPDYFSPDGQLWGNPLFAWDVLKKSRYQWWMERLKKNFELFDVVRLDHFRGFYDYWSIPFGQENAIAGEWQLGPGIDFFHEVAKKFPHPKFIAEDLGILSPGAIEFRKKLGLPGMAILQFAFGGDAKNPYLPHNLDAQTVLYTGSHDNNTSLGWYQDSPETVRDHFRRYFRVNGNETPWDLIRSSYASVCALTILPLQDLFSLGSTTRINSPGTPQGNWQWRYTPQNWPNWQQTAAYLKELAKLYGR
jgi:4-alpha-glucanotransferase